MSTPRTFTVTIDLKGDAFFEYPGTEIARLLREAGEAVDGHGICDLPNHPRKLFDVNGNAAGTFVAEGG